MRVTSDEKYILDLLSTILNAKYIWQHKFDRLLGDKDKNGVARKLPVDAYFPKYNLIIEYLEQQHFRPIKIMDKRMTVSGITRDKQRKKYHNRRKKFASMNGIDYLELSYKGFGHFKNGRLKRLKYSDISVITNKLKKLDLLK